MAAVRVRRWLVGIALLAAAGLALWAVQPPVSAPPLEPPLYADFEVTLEGPWVALRNTGTEALAPVSLVFEADTVGSPILGYGGTERFEEWVPGQVLRIGIPGESVTVRNIRFTGFGYAQGAKRVFRLRYGDRPADLLGGTALSDEDVGFDPNLAAAVTSERP